ncbi:hypothetical protein HDF16_005903 [Granulicella aggregans]|uniref:Uncharacterized protein n=1 Tax=Granulicella aggregans TaxID=474949 RepID=A0A7W7ZJZ1_9BACT|nr:hypothetical protein [Granulicella aggregans]MBB5061167.1 hypothetical protein [Granulicella aggregans]
MYRTVPRSEIFDALEHLRALHRQSRPSNERERHAAERRELLTKNLLSNLHRTQDHPTLRMLLEIADALSLTIEGAHRLFGYDLAEIREYDRQLNGRRTRIVESYTFERDRLSDVPLDLAPPESFASDGTLRDLVRTWQRDVPARSLRGTTWRRPGVFYVHVGTEDSLGSSLPPGSIALVEPIEEDEMRQPHPRSIYLLQFRNGYRCSGCMVIRSKLYLLTPERTYAGPQEFAYPGSVRIAGRIRMFATRLPLPEYSTISLAQYQGSGELVLPWEHQTRDRLLATKYRRFQRSHDEEQSIRQFLETELKSRFSERTLRRYRSPGRSEPHVDVLLTLSLMHSVRYTDALQSGGYTIRDTGRFSLDSLLTTKNYADLLVPRQIASTPMPREVWETRRQEFAEWPSLLAVRFPQLRIWDDRVIRLAQEKAIEGLSPAIKPGTWMLLEPLSSVPDTRVDARKRGWSQPIYVLRRGVEIICGRLVREGNRFVLLANPNDVGSKIVLDADDLRDVSRVSGVAVPV